MFDYHKLAVQLLQGADLITGPRSDCDGERVTARQSRGVAHFILKRESPDHGGVRNGLASFGGIDNQIELLVFEHVRHIWTAFVNLVDQVTRQGLIAQICQPQTWLTEDRAVLKEEVRERMSHLEKWERQRGNKYEWVVKADMSFITLSLTLYPLLT